ncbi:MAG TPA: hypothetical protein VF947_09810, partial [Myxococcales bacterium]
MFAAGATLFLVVESQKAMLALLLGAGALVVVIRRLKGLRPFLQAAAEHEETGAVTGLVFALLLCVFFRDDHFTVFL